MPRLAFLVMPFDKSLDPLANAILACLRERQFEANRADDFTKQGNILKDIVVPLAQCDLVVADLTDLNPNVMYEIGLAHAFGTPVILLARDIESLPFDLRSYRVMIYSPMYGEFERFLAELSEKLDRIESVAFGSPVLDFLGRAIRPVPSSDQAAVLASVGSVATAGGEASPPGYLDDLLEIGEGLSSIAGTFNDLTVAMSDFNPDIARSAEALEQAHAATTQGSGVRQAQIAARMAADALARFTGRTASARSGAAERWKVVDEAFAHVLEWQASHVDDSNREEVLRSLAEIESLERVSATTHDQITRFRESLWGIYGFDRGLSSRINEATRELDEVLSLSAAITATLARAQPVRARLTPPQ